MIDTCPACGTRGLEAFHEQASIPVNSCLLLADRVEAERFPRGRLRLGLCRRCGLISNMCFDSSLAEYSSRYEETQGFSSRFQQFAADLAKRWVDKYDLYGKDVVEIGCGKGEFLTLMCEAGVGRGVGIDPGVHPERIDDSVAGRITWIPDFFSERYNDFVGDAVVCRHTLEHIHPVGDFMRLVRRAIGDRTDTVVLFELPDVLRVLREVAFWDVYYEHCSYFSAGSLARLFRAVGFEVLDLSLDYDDQYLLIEARPADAPAEGLRFAVEDDLPALREGARRFMATYHTKLAEWRADLRGARAQGNKAVIWGAGSKGVAYLNGLGVGDEISYCVDINPYKHGMYMAGTGHRIVSPEFLASDQPDVVIAMNAIYLDEIRRDLDALGVNAELTAV